MKLKSFRIKNYKSIVDSGVCYVESDLTIFAGKNESGKTSLLEALTDLNADVSISETCKPIKADEAIPEITATFAYTPSEVKEYLKAIGVESNIEVDVSLTVTKTYPDSFEIDGKSASLLQLSIEDVEDLIENIFTKLEKIERTLEANPSLKPTSDTLLIDKDNLIGTLEAVQVYKVNYEQVFSTQVSEPTSMQSQINSWLDEVLRGLEHAIKQSALLESNWATFKNFLPNFILFRSFDDVIPNEVLFEELDTNIFVRDLSLISNLDISVLKASESRNKLKHKKELNLKFNDDYKKFWEQDSSTITIDWDSTTLLIWIEEDGELYKPSERSKGKQWHMSFYIRASARTINNRTNVILIDEPGLFLHATAQNDVYNKLLDLSTSNQVLFTTHSPYLLNRDQLNRVRLVMKNASPLSGTKVENSIHAKADKETLTPILTAIGLNLNDGIQNIAQLRNVVVEGPSDYFYLQALKRILGNKEFNVIFGGGSGNVGNVGAILTGWGCEVRYLFDNDKGKKDGSKNLSTNWHVSKDLIHSIIDEDGAIEDLFSKQDFRKFVLKDETLTYDMSNSKYLKGQTMNKVILSRSFYASLADVKIQLDDDSKSRAKKLFESLKF